MSNEGAKSVDNTKLFGSGKTRNDSEEFQDKPKKKKLGEKTVSWWAQH